VRAVSFEVYGDARKPAPFIFTCEHASNALPPTDAWSWDVNPADRELLDDHWGWDIGAADLTRALADEIGGAAVLSEFSRLIVDPNRPTDAPTYIVEEIDGHAISFNVGLTEEERARRTREYWAPYHEACDAQVGARAAVDKNVWVIGVHSFTPLYLGRPRPMEIGVLFDDYDKEAFDLEGALDEDGFETALNAPWSGKDGLIYSCDRHAKAHGLLPLELEVRYDLIDTPEKAGSVARRIARALMKVAPHA
jgi:predicted N-formylglutamate amidohydrolase